jgi:hypothetical protein
MVALGGIGDIVSAAANVATDPCLGQVADLALQLHSLEQPGAAAPGSPGVPGIGLCSAVMPLQVVVWVRQNPWSAVAVSIALIGGLIGIGYNLAGGNRS